MALSEAGKLIKGVLISSRKVLLFKGEVGEGLSGWAVLGRKRGEERERR